jgi:hypothetical protein
MSASYPTSVYAPRTKANRPGVVYDALKTTVGYAEDISKLDAEVVALETEMDLRSNDLIFKSGKKLHFTDSDISIYATSPGNLVMYGVGSTTVGLAGDVNIGGGSTYKIKIGTTTTQLLGFFNATEVVRSTGWSPTNVTTDKVFDANETTINELADVLGSLIIQLRTYGLIGA